MRPSDFSYKHEAKHNSCLVVAQLWDDVKDSDDLVLENLAHLLDTVKACKHLLRIAAGDNS